jgi:D-alanine-D-alanine ligase
MSANRVTTVGVLFGGRSVEHDVSIITGHQVMMALANDPTYEIVPIYIDRHGRWFSGDPLRELKNFQQFRDEVTSLKGVQTAILSPSTQHHGIILNPLAGRFDKAEIKRLDVVFPTIHGSHGEDGTLQGLFELADIPYVGCGVLASALANDKILCKIALSQQGIPIVEAVSFNRAEWLDEPDKVISHIVHELKIYPLFVKPATLGSSIGVAKVTDEAGLRAAIDVALSLDSRILVEISIENAVEINCALLGAGSEIQASVLEQPVSLQELLTFEEKYMRGSKGMVSAERIIPAPLSTELTTKIQNYAVAAFRAIEGRGTARIDFLVRPESNEVFLNEINTLPGSFSFYLWNTAQGPTSQHPAQSPTEIVRQLIQIARDAFAEKRKNVYDYQTGLVEFAAAKGLKGMKGKSSSGQTAR